MNNLVIRSQAEMASTVEAILRGIMDGLKAAGDAGAMAQPPENIVVSGVYLVEANAAQENSSRVTPSSVVTTVETTPGATVNSTETDSGNTTTENATPSGRTVQRNELGGDRDLTNYDYEAVS